MTNTIDPLEFTESLPPGKNYPERISDFELELLLANTNSEVRCLLLGVLDAEQPKAIDDVHTELESAGAYKFRRLDRTYLQEKYQNFTPGLIDTNRKSEFTLTEFGTTVQGFAGNILDIGLIHDLSLEKLLGTRRLGNFDKIDDVENPKFSQAARLFTAFTIAGLGYDQVPIIDVFHENIQSAGVSEKTFNYQLSSLALAGLVKITSVGHNMKRFLEPAELLVNIREDLAQTVVPVLQSEPSATRHGSVKIKQFIKNSSSLGILVERSLESRGKVSEQWLEHEEMAYDLLEDGPLNTRDMYDLARAKFGYTGTFDSFRKSLNGAVDRVTNSSIIRLSNDRKNGKPVVYDRIQ